MRFTRLLLVLFFSVVAMTLAGCAQPSLQKNMSVSKADLQRSLNPNGRFKDKMTICEVGGGRETNPIWTSQVSNKEFKGALECSLINVGFYNPDPKARYQLSGTLDKLSQPLLGFDMTVTAQATYRVYDQDKQKVIFEKTIKTPYKEKFSSSYLAVERLRLANEGAVRENIKSLLTHLHQM